ncbi:GNAT family N-acetyltransferase [Zobellia alginiliquefaciens]|uniref:GNAT family N-acetyltransferase n=1 Tax=Zobellia alginiliquefaciens TaxID=3032586 RepID=UPI0023E40D47|nr:GNAT family N-acetyltransferase [Zobellia alginiliquefaciens]
MVAYRTATLGDAVSIAGLHVKSWQENYRGAFSDAYLDELALGEREKIWHDRLENPLSRQTVIVAEKGGDLVGFVCAFFDVDDDFGTLLDNLHVSKDVQGMGIGKRLMSLIAKEVQDREPNSGLYLWVLESNEAALRFYERQGGKRLETVEGNDIGDKPIMKVRYHWSSMEKLIDKK